MHVTVADLQGVVIRKNHAKFSSRRNMSDPGRAEPAGRQVVAARARFAANERSHAFRRFAAVDRRRVAADADGHAAHAGGGRDRGTESLCRGASAGGIPSDRPGPEPDAVPERVGGMGAAARGRHSGKQKVEATHPPWFDDTIEEVLCENSGRALGDGLSRTQIGWVGHMCMI